MLSKEDALQVLQAISGEVTAEAAKWIQDPLHGQAPGVSIEIETVVVQVQVHLTVVQADGTRIPEQGIVFPLPPELRAKLIKA